MPTQIKNLGGERTANIVHGEIIVHASYTGGPYIELGFTKVRGHKPQPIEVINVCDYRKSYSDPDRYDPRVRVKGGVRAIVQEWIKDVTDEDQGGDPDAIARYYENSGY